MTKQDLESTTQVSRNTHGGRRDGAGRKPLGRIQTRLQLTAEEANLIKQLGGSAFIRALLEKIKTKEFAIPVDTTKFTDEEKDRFVDGWTEAGGDTDDAEADTPWFAPWEWQPEITVRGTTPEEWGADWYAQCKPEIDAIRAADEDEEED